MTERPILFSAPMVRALLDGRKTQTRRVLGRLARFGAVTEFGPSDTPGFDWHFRDPQKRWHDLRDNELGTWLPFAVGDALWVREAFIVQQIDQIHALPSSYFNVCIDYPAGKGLSFEHYRRWVTPPVAECPPILKPPRKNGADGNAMLRPGIHLPRIASRLTLKVTGVKVERARDISSDDAEAEGIYFDKIGFTAGHIGNRGVNQEWSATPEIAFFNLWRAINGRESLDANPWVVAVSFEVIKANIADIAKREAA